MSRGDRASSKTPPSATRRDFLQQAAGLAAGVAALAPAAAAGSATSAPLPTIQLGPHTVTRLILGGNPIYGHSHFNKHLSQHMIDWHTPEHVQQLLDRAQQAGINTWQNSFAERTLADLDRHRQSGGILNWLCLGKPDWDEKPHFIDEVAKRHPIGIAPHGALAEKLHRQGKLGTLTDLLKRIRDQGVLVGLSAHNPDLLALANDQDWDVDYFMCCLYYLTRPKDELRKLLGSDLPLGEIYLPSDPPRMFKVIQSIKKPCLAYKVLAAGRRVSTPAEVRSAFQTALENIKPTDALIVGMYQQFGDQVGANVALVRELCGQQSR